MFYFTYITTANEANALRLFLTQRLACIAELSFTVFRRKQVTGYKHSSEIHNTLEMKNRREVRSGRYFGPIDEVYIIS